MIWNKPRYGDVRERWAFPLIPLTIGEETRWFQWCRIREEYGVIHYPGPFPFGGTDRGWYPIEWLDKRPQTSQAGTYLVLLELPTDESYNTTWTFSVQAKDSEEARQKASKIAPFKPHATRMHIVRLSGNQVTTIELKETTPS